MHYYGFLTSLWVRATQNVSRAAHFTICISLGLDSTCTILCRYYRPVVIEQPATSSHSGNPKCFEGRFHRKAFCVCRAGHALLRSPPESFLWLQHYGGLQQSQEGTPLQSPGEPPRQSIAEGATPLAARESVVRLQLAMREDDYTHLQELR